MPIISKTHRYVPVNIEDERTVTVKEKGSVERKISKGIETHLAPFGWLRSFFGKSFKVKEEGKTIWLNSQSARHYLEFNYEKLNINPKAFEGKLKGKTISQVGIKDLGAGTLAKIFNMGLTLKSSKSPAEKIEDSPATTTDSEPEQEPTRRSKTSGRSDLQASDSVDLELATQLSNIEALEEENRNLLSQLNANGAFPKLRNLESLKNEPEKHLQALQKRNENLKLQLIAAQMKSETIGRILQRADAYSRDDLKLLSIKQLDELERQLIDQQRAEISALQAESKDAYNERENRPLVSEPLKIAELEINNDMSSRLQASIQVIKGSSTLEGRSLVQVKDDGNCFFYALGAGLLYSLSQQDEAAFNRFKDKFSEHSEQFQIFEDLYKSVKANIPVHKAMAEVEIDETTQTATAKGELLANFLRGFISDLIEKNTIQITDVYNNREDAAKQMRNPRTFGGSQEAEIFSKATETNIAEIAIMEGQIVEMPNTNEGDLKIELFYYGSSQHYDLLIPSS